jgi:hypothetical protein
MSESVREIVAAMAVKVDGRLREALLDELAFDGAFSVVSLLSHRETAIG